MLTEELILSKYPNYTDITKIKKLDIWGEDIQDISILSEMKKLSILSLSSNNVNDLSPLESCLNLRELYLRNNNISSFEEITHLKNLSKLKILWLEGNPIYNDPLYRYKILQILPQISVLDNQNCNSKLTKLDNILNRNQSAEQNRKVNYSLINNFNDKKKNLKKKRNKKIILRRVFSCLGTPKVTNIETSNEEISVINKRKNYPSNENENIVDLKFFMDKEKNQENHTIKKLKLRIIDDKETSKNNRNNNSNFFNNFENILSKRKMSVQNEEGPIQLKSNYCSNLSSHSKIKEKKNYSSRLIPMPFVNDIKNRMKKEKKIFYDNQLNDENSIQKNYISDSNNNHVVQAIYLLIDKLNINELLKLKEEINKKIKAFS